MSKTPKSRYKSYGQSGNFKRRGESLAIQIDRIRQQNETKINGLRRLANNEKENADLQIRGLEAKNRSELENKRLLNDFENKVTANKRNQLNVRADREVEHLRGRADEFGRASKFWQEFATEHSEQYAKLALGIGNLADRREYRKLLENVDPNFAYEAAKKFTEGTKIVEKNANDELAGSNLHPITKKDITIKAGSSNTHYLTKQLQQIKENRTFYTSLLQRIGKTPDGKSLLTADLAQETYTTYAWHLLEQLNIDPTTYQGREIINTFGVWGRDVAEQRWNHNTSLQDKASRVAKAETLASEIKLYKAAAEGSPEQKTALDNMQITFQGLHHIVQGSIYEGDGGKFGLKNWNPQTTNAAILELLFPHYKDLPFHELYEVFDSIVAFDSKTGNPIKENGSTVGILTKSPELVTKLSDLVTANEKLNSDIAKSKQLAELNSLVKPYETAWEEAVETQDFTKFKEMEQSYIALVNTDRFKDSDHRMTAYNRTRFTVNDFGNYNTYESALGELSEGNIEEAMIIIANNYGGKEIDEGYARGVFTFGYNNPEKKKFVKLSKAVRNINSLENDLGTVDTAALDIYKASFGTTAFEEKALNVADKRIIKAIKQHLLREIVKDNSDDPAYVVMENATATVEKAFLNGIENQQGLYAATPAAESNWSPAKRVDGVIVSEGGYGKRGRTSTRPSNISNYVFHNFDNRLDSNVTLSPKDIGLTFFVEGGNSTWNAPVSKEHLQEKISENINGPNSILTVDHKNYIADIALGRVKPEDANNIFNNNQNLKLLITMARKHNKNITQKTVMDMVIKGLSENKEADYSILEGKTYPAGIDDIALQITGQCTGNDKNDYAKCLTTLLKEKGIELNNLANYQLLNLYK